MPRRYTTPCPGPILYCGKGQSPGLWVTLQPTKFGQTVSEAIGGFSTCRDGRGTWLAPLGLGITNSLPKERLSVTQSTASRLDGCDGVMYCRRSSSRLCLTQQTHPEPYARDTRTTMLKSSMPGLGSSAGPYDRGPTRAPGAWTRPGSG